MPAAPWTVRQDRQCRQDRQGRQAGIMLFLRKKGRINSHLKEEAYGRLASYSFRVSKKKRIAFSVKEAGGGRPHPHIWGLPLPLFHRERGEAAPVAVAVTVIYLGKTHDLSLWQTANGSRGNLQEFRSLFSNNRGTNMVDPDQGR